MFNNKNILVTGGTGLVGRELVELLVNQGANVTSASLDNNNFNEEWGVDYLNTDLRVLKNCICACEGKDFVFHIAGIKGSQVITKTKQYTFFTSILQLNTSMISAMYASNMGRGIYTSTVGTYGQSEIFRESELWDKNPSPNDWFAGWAKRMGEVQIDAYQQQYGEQNISIMKPVNIYGKYDNKRRLIPTLVKAKKNKILKLQDCLQVTDIIHVNDVCEVIYNLGNSKVRNETYNLGSGKPIGLRTIVKTVSKIKDNYFKYRFNKINQKTISNYCYANTDKLKSIIKFKVTKFPKSNHEIY